jgi:hypothetical protein
LLEAIAGATDRRAWPALSFIDQVVRPTIGSLLQEASAAAPRVIRGVCESRLSPWQQDIPRKAFAFAAKDHRCRKAPMNRVDKEERISNPIGLTDRLCLPARLGTAISRSGEDPALRARRTSDRA